MTELEDNGVRVLRDLRPERSPSGEAGTRAIVDLVADRLFGGGGGDDGSPRPANTKTLGRYEIRGRISYGGMGQVLRAWDPFLCREVAIKVCLPGHDRDARERLFNEARALSQLIHKNVVRLLHADVLEDQLCVVLELIEGPTLTTWIETKPSWQAIYDVFVEIGEALAAAHRKKLLHRDVKPSNVLLAPDGTAKLIDFGLVAAIDPDDEDTLTDLDEPGRLFGTRGFLAPELVLGEPPSVQSDLFAYAVTFYWALYRTNPFPAHSGRSGLRGTPGAPASAPPTAQSSTAAGLLGPYREPTGPAPRWLARILRRALHPERAHRYGTVDALLADLRRAARVRPYTLRAGALVAVLVGSYAVGAARAPEPGASEPLSCEDTAATDLWTDRSDAVAARLAAAASPSVRAAAGPIADELGRYAAALDRAGTDLCEDRRAAPDSLVVAGQTACVARARESFAARLGRPWDDLADPQDLALPDLRNCTNAIIAAQACHAPLDDDDARAVEAELARSRDARAAGDLAGAVEAARAAASRADATRFSGLKARAHHALGEALYDAGAYLEASDELLHVRDHAFTGACQDVLVDALSRLTKISARVGLFSDDVALDRQGLQFTGARALEDLERQAEAHNDRALLLMLRESNPDPAAAIRDLERAVGLRKELLPSMRVDLAQAESYLNLGTARHALGDEAGVAAALAQEAALRSAALGERHPSHFKRHLNLGQWATDAGRLDEAQRELAAALELARGYGERSLELARVEFALARLTLRRGDVESARALAVAAGERASAVPASNLAFDVVMGTAHLRAVAGDLAGARTLLDGALATYSRSGVGRPARIGEIFARIAIVADSAGNAEDTETHARAAVARFHGSGVFVHPYLALAEAKLGRALAGLVDPKSARSIDRARLLEARQAFDAAIEGWELQASHPLAPTERAFTHLDRAIVRCALGDREAARFDRAAASRLAEVAGTTGDLREDFEALQKRAC